MPWDLTATGGPIFASRSRVNTDSRDFGTLAAGSMPTIVERLIDGDPESYWHSADGDDAITETITASFHKRTAQVSQSIDIVALQNINLKNFLLEYSNDNGGTFATVPGFDFQVGVADNDKADLIKAFTPVTANYLRLTMYRTFVVDDQKRVGGLYAVLGTTQPVLGGMEKYDRKFRETLRSVMAGDGSRFDEVVRRSAVSYEHYGAQIGFDLLTKAELDAIRAIKRAGSRFTFVAEPFDVPRDVYTCLFKGAWADAYTSRYKGAGYRLNLNVEEVGEL